MEKLEKKVTHGPSIAAASIWAPSVLRARDVRVQVAPARGLQPAYSVLSSPCSYLAVVTENFAGV